MLLAERAVISVKTSTGEAGSAGAVSVPFDQVPFLRKNRAARRAIASYLWNTGVPSTVAIYPNLTTSEPVVRKLLHDRRFRQALSLGINREEINQILYYGLGLPGQNTVLRSPAGHEEPRMAYARFDLAQANRLLNAMGLTARDGRGFRLRPDGWRLDLIVETSGEETEHTDVLELVKDTWGDLGIELLIRPSQLEVFRRRVFSGEAMMSAYNGNFGFGLPTPDMSPDWLAPVSQQQLQWPKWGAYFEARAGRGEAPTIRRPGASSSSTSDGSCPATRTSALRVWAEMLDINAEEVFTIGIVGGTLQPIVVVKNEAPRGAGQASTPGSPAHTSGSIRPTPSTGRRGTGNRSRRGRPAAPARAGPGAYLGRAKAAAGTATGCRFRIAPAGTQRSTSVAVRFFS